MKQLILALSLTILPTSIMAESMVCTVEKTLMINSYHFVLDAESQFQFDTETQEFHFFVNDYRTKALSSNQRGDVIAYDVKLHEKANQPALFYFFPKQNRFTIASLHLKETTFYFENGHCKSI
jgi:hypothetical protein